MHMLAAALLLVALAKASDGAQCACATTAVHVRSGAGTGYHVIGTLQSGSCVTYTGRKQAASGYTWASLDFHGQDGWAATDWLSISDCSGGSAACSGSHTYHARGTAYYPANDPIEGGFVDMRGHKLNTLQDFLEGHAPYVSTAMDNKAGIAYGTKICIPELNHKYNRDIVFEVVDTGSAFFGKGHSRIDICVRSRTDSYDSTINGPLTLIFP